MHFIYFCLITFDWKTNKKATPLCGFLSALHFLCTLLAAHESAFLHFISYVHFVAIQCNFASLQRARKFVHMQLFINLSCHWTQIINSNINHCAFIFRECDSKPRCCDTFNWLRCAYLCTAQIELCSECECSYLISIFQQENRHSSVEETIGHYASYLCVFTCAHSFASTHVLHSSFKFAFSQRENRSKRDK